MEDEYVADNMVIYIEKNITEKFNYDSIINEFKNMKKRCAILYICVISFIIIVY